MLAKISSSLQRKKSEGGFTLIELLVVILIIGILSAIVVVAVRGSTGDAKAKACSQNAVNLNNAIDRYRADNEDGLPAGGAGSAAGYTKPAGVTSLDGAYSEEELSTALIPVYIKTIPPITEVVAVKFTANTKQSVGVLCLVANGKNAGI